jgi:hypothetical protein
MAAAAPNPSSLAPCLQTWEAVAKLEKWIMDEPVAKPKKLTIDN